MTAFMLEQKPKHYSCRDLCERCGLSVSVIEEFIELGIIAPANTTGDGEHQFSIESYWFSIESYVRLRKALRIQRDLAVNPPGVALVMDLLDEIDALRKQQVHK